MKQRCWSWEKGLFSFKCNRRIRTWNLKFQVLGNALRTSEFPFNKLFKNKTENNLSYLMDSISLFLLYIYCMLAIINMMRTYMTDSGRSPSGKCECIWVRKGRLLVQGTIPKWGWRQRRQPEIWNLEGLVIQWFSMWHPSMFYKWANGSPQTVPGAVGENRCRIDQFPGCWYLSRMLPGCRWDQVWIFALKYHVPFLNSHHNPMR